MIAMPGTGWTPYMFAVARTGKLEENIKDSINILDILTSIYADHKDEISVLQYVTTPNELDMTAMGNIKCNIMTFYLCFLIIIHRLHHFIILLDIALLNHDEEAYDLLNSLETFMNNQTVESELISISSNESGEKDVDNATQAFLDAALTGNLKLLTSLYHSGTKVLYRNALIFILWESNHF